ncbi:MAG: helix-turn-helix transcriptional regulator [Kangiellaceae bacterium]|nr:helix-turn-helix transcriptional regulator [Kangiellaceae bacterium]
MTNLNSLNKKWEAQLRKGTLEIAIMAALREQKLYGLELLKLLQSLESMQITEGTLYPLMDRLKREGLISAEWVQEGDSRPRKYFQLTTHGKEKLSILTTMWRQSVIDVETLLTNANCDNQNIKGVSND